MSMRMKLSRWGRPLGTLAAAVLGLTLLAAGPAHAEPADVEPSGTCWFNTDDEQTQCFANDVAFEAAVEDQTGGVLLLAGEQAPQARGGVQPLATYIIATLYVDSNYGGSSLVVTTGYSTLCTAHSYYGNSMPTGWANVVSSFHSYGTCKTRLSANNSQFGAQYGPYANSSYVGDVMNDNAQSYWVTG